MAEQQKVVTTVTPRLIPSQRSLLAALLLASGLTVLVTLILMFFSVLVVSGWAVSQLRQFSQAANLSVDELVATAYAGWTTTPAQTNGRQNILILGLDSLATRGDAPALTDTIILVSLDMSTGHMNSLSFPRDLWLPEYQTRINALYYYGQERFPTKPHQFPQQVMSDWIQVPIHHTVILTLEEVAALVDLVDGVTVDVPVAFSDDQFPRTDVDVTLERDPAKLYTTVSFEAGTQTMTGARALEYIRSRKSEGETGGDGARVNRQQQIITALLHKATDPANFTDPTKAGQLVAFYQAHFAQYYPLTEAIGLIRQLWPTRNNIDFVGHSFSIYPEDPQGALVHPPEQKYYGQWLYIIRDQDVFFQEIKTALNVP